MEKIGKRDLENVDLTDPAEYRVRGEKFFTDEDLERVQEALETPTNIQSELAAKIKIFLDEKMEEEMKNQGYLSHFTRLWIKEFKDVLDNLHKNLYGEKSVNFHLGKISHGHIASEMREYSDEIENAKGDKKKLKITIEEDDEEVESEEDKEEVEAVVEESN